MGQSREIASVQLQPPARAAATSRAKPADVVIRALLIASTLGLALFAAHSILGLGGASTDFVFGGPVYDTLIIVAGVVCVLRGASHDKERWAWLLLGTGILVWAAGEVYYTWVLYYDANPPFPSPADIGFLGFYPFMYAGIVRLLRADVQGFGKSLLLDGLLGGLTAAAVGLAILFDVIYRTTGGAETAAKAVTLAYPLGDILLMAIVVGIAALGGWRLGRTWGLLLAGLAVTAFADASYAYETAAATYSVDAWFEPMWPLSALLIAFAAWQSKPTANARRLSGGRSLLVPSAFALAAIVVICLRSVTPYSSVAVGVAAAALVVAVVRMTLTIAENQRLQHEVQRDSLTGLANRGKLLLDLSRALALASPGEPRVLILFDLDGFKLYNDTFGHPAGDALLSRLSRRLQASVESYGGAYRVGGDEFCALLEPDGSDLTSLIASAGSALEEHGDGFHVKSSYGAVVLPQEAGSAERALQLADQRMYEQKDVQRASARSQVAAALMRTLAERHPEPSAYEVEVSELARRTAKRLGLARPEADRVERAARLHDVGNVAIPDAILDKPGPLDEEELEFVHQHTILGERIIGAAPALAPEAKLVRSTHERVDGAGYPDRLAAGEIPIGSRIIFVCGAFCAMISERPYRAAMTPVTALAELRRCAGSQFDLRVVEAVCAEVEAWLPRSGLEPVAQRSSNGAPSPAEQVAEHVMGVLATSPGVESPVAS